MRLRLSKLLVLGVLAAALLVTAASAAVRVFATLPGAATPPTPESITPTASGLFVTDANGPIWKVPIAGESGAQVANLSTVTWRGGLILPSTFTGLSGKFLAVGGDVPDPSGPAY